LSTIADIYSGGALPTAEAHCPGNSSGVKDSDTVVSYDWRLYIGNKIELEKVFRRIKEKRPRFTPVLAPIISSRRIAGILVLAAVLQIGLTTAGLPGWQCPLKTALTIPCPGCGLSTAAVGLLQGNWHRALQVHPFGPVFLAGILLLMLTSLLSANSRKKVAYLVEKLERRTGFLILIALGLFIHWVFRFYSAIEF
jgi:hypothetical protein